jgi:hypothetical protein
MRLERQVGEKGGRGASAWLPAAARHAPVVAATAYGGRIVHHTQATVAWREHVWRGGVWLPTKHANSSLLSTETVSGNPK